jgi:hypothetical protein
METYERLQRELFHACLRYYELHEGGDAADDDIILAILGAVEELGQELQASYFDLTEV